MFPSKSGRILESSYTILLAKEEVEADLVGIRTLYIDSVGSDGELLLIAEFDLK